MLKIQKKGMALSQRAEIEAAVARTEQNAANIEYIAMMSDINLEEDMEDDSDE